MMATSSPPPPPPTSWLTSLYATHQHQQPTAAALPPAAATAASSSHIFSHPIQRDLHLLSHLPHYEEACAELLLYLPPPPPLPTPPTPPTPTPPQPSSSSSSLLLSSSISSSSSSSSSSPSVSSFRVLEYIDEIGSVGAGRLLSAYQALYSLAPSTAQMHTQQLQSWISIHTHNYYNKHAQKLSNASASTAASWIVAQSNFLRQHLAVPNLIDSSDLNSQKFPIQFDLVVSGVGGLMNTIVQHDSSPIRNIIQAMKPGGHLFLLDQCGAAVPLPTLCRKLEQAGLVDVDIAYRRQGMVIIGARKPTGSEADNHGQKVEWSQPKPVHRETVSSSSTPATALQTNAVSSVASSSSSVRQSAPSSSVSVSESSSNYTSSSSLNLASLTFSSPISELPADYDPLEIAQAMYNNSRDPKQKQQALSPPNSHPAATLTPSEHVAQLFRTFAPQGLMEFRAISTIATTFHKQEKLDEEDLWWMYHSLAEEDPVTGEPGLTLQGLQQLYEQLNWNAEEDAKRIRR